MASNQLQRQNEQIGCVTRKYYGGRMRKAFSMRQVNTSNVVNYLLIWHTYRTGALPGNACL